LSKNFTLSLLVIIGIQAPLAWSVMAEDIGGADLTAPPAANEENTSVVLSGTLQKVLKSGVITLGYREASFPFSFIRPGSPQPLGYSVDLCLAVVDEVVRELHGNPTRVVYQPVTAETRIDAVASGRVDLECGSTTSNAERQASVSFSPIIYVAGTKLLVKRSSGIRSYEDLGGKTLVVTSGTTNEVAMRKLNDKYKLGITIVAARDHDASYAMLADGRADAFATDDVLLYGFIAAKKAQATMVVVGDFITYEPYGLMFRKDDPLMTAAVTRAFQALGKSRSLASLYRKWFLQPTPTGALLNLPMSVQLTEVFRGMGAED
jgi:glutamate/aspartate transport system substrate-binding protein